MRTCLWLTILLVVLASIVAAQDPLTILDQLPPPEVEYETAPVNSYPHEEQKVVEEYPKLVPPEPEPANIDTGKLIDQSTPASFKSLANLVKTISTPQASKTVEISEEKNEIQVSKPAQIDPTKIKIVPARSKAYQSFKILQNNQLISDWQSSLQQNYQLFCESIELSQKFSQNSAQKGEEASEEEGEEGAEKSFDAVFAKAKGLQKKEKWSEIIELFQENGEAADSKEGLEMILESRLNEAKTDLNSIKRSGDRLARLDKKNPWANYALAYYFYNAKKPNPTKASNYLNLALKAKNPPPGASKLYWTALLKKLWMVPLLLLAALIGGVNHVMKKKKAAKLLLAEGESSEPESTTEPTSDAGKTGLAAKLSPLLKKLQPLLDKLKKKKPEAGPVETDADLDSNQQTAEVQQSAESVEPAEPTDSADSDESDESAESVESVEPVEPVESAEPAEAAAAEESFGEEIAEQAPASEEEPGEPDETLLTEPVEASEEEPVKEE